jgi:glutathione S-transferase
LKAEENVLQIWGRSNSVNVQKVLWCCEELALPYERLDAGGKFGVVDTDEYRRLNPNRLVPTIVDDGFVLWESNVIVRYLAATHGAGVLWADDPKRRASADMWMDWSQTVLWPMLRPLFLGIVRAVPEYRDPKILEDARRKTAEALAIVDAHLADRPYVAGAFSMGDIPLGCAIWRWMAMPIERPEMPNVTRWFQSLQERAAFRTIVMVPLS